MVFRIDSFDINAMKMNIINVAKNSVHIEHLIVLGFCGIEQIRPQPTHSRFSISPGDVLISGGNVKEETDGLPYFIAHEGGINIQIEGRAEPSPHFIQSVVTKYSPCKKMLNDIASYKRNFLSPINEDKIFMC